MRLAWGIALITAPIAVHAQDTPPNRYQVTPFPKLQISSGNDALIVDQKTGDVWIYRDVTGQNNQAGGSIIVYEGKVSPGTKPGQIVARQGFGQKPIP